MDTQGDAFFLRSPAPGASAAAATYRGARTRPDPGAYRPAHGDAAASHDEGYVGKDVHFAARVAALGPRWSGRPLEATAELVEGSLTDLGEHRLKDIERAVSIYQLGDESFPPLKTISNTNLPRPASSFVGRERELDEVVSRDRGGSTTVTLTGPAAPARPGSRSRRRPSSSRRTRQASSGSGSPPCATPRSSRETIAQTLGAKDGLAEHIGEREMLLLLDNLEQVIEAAPELSSLLQSCPNLTLLVTSRELLRVQGEVEYPVPPLAEPEAVSLFCERSQLEPSGGDRRALLAPRRAPARGRARRRPHEGLSPDADPGAPLPALDLLKGGRDADPRQQTLRATIEWSYDLLAEEEQQLFARLSVFQGGCTLEAAEGVIAADIDGLQSLVEKSLLRRSDGRYWMLETIRDLARERFDASGEAEALGRDHAEWFLAVAERAEPFLKSAEQEDWLQRLEDDHDNLRQSLDWLLAHDETELAGRLAAALWLFWWMHGHFGEARRWLRRALEAGSDEPSETRAKLLDGAGYLAFEQYDDEAVGLLEASLSCAKEVGATSTAAFAAAHVGGVLAWTGSGNPTSRRRSQSATRRSASLARQGTTTCSRSRSTISVRPTTCSGTRSE